MSSYSFSAETIAEEVANIFSPEIRGRNVLITGVSPNSIGAEVVRALALYANLIIIAGRSEERTSKVVRAVKEQTPDANIRTLIMDLSSLASIRLAARTVNAYVEPIHILFNNAAGSTASFTLTTDGFEYQFGVNYLGHFLFTNLVLPRLVAAATSTFSPRIINVSSEGHLASSIRWDDPNYKLRQSEYDRYVAYGQSKTANVLFSKELAKRLKRENILSFSLHPGAVWTNLALTIPKEDLIALGFMDGDGKLTDLAHWKTVGQGASTHLVAAFDPTIIEHNGGYLVDCKVQNNRQAPHTTSDDDAERLWVLSEELVGEKFLVDSQA